MAGFGSRGGLFLNTPLKKGHCVVDNGKEHPERQWLNVKIYSDAPGKSDYDEAVCSATTGNQEKGKI